jgi:hypothetical protein
MLHKQIQRVCSPSRLSGLARCAITIAGGLLLAFAMQAHAAIMAGDQFIFNFIVTAGPATGLTGSVDVTLGAAQADPYFAIAGFDVTQAGGFCGVCTPLTEDLSHAQFDSATFGLLGEITGTFIGSGGNNTHSFDLVLTDIVNGTGTFTFTNTKLVEPPQVEVDSGTYTPLVPAVDEPSEMVLLALGLVSLAASRRRKR